MSQKWNLQDIRPVEPRKRRPSQAMKRPVRNTDEDSEIDSETSSSTMKERGKIPSIVIEDGNKSSKNRLFLSIGLFVLIVGSAVGLSAILGKTELTIYPEFREPNISAEFLAYPDNREDSLSYEILTLEATSESQAHQT